MPLLIECFDTRAGDGLLALGTVIVRGVRVSLRLGHVVLAFVANGLARVVRVVLLTGSNATRAFFAVQGWIVVYNTNKYGACHSF